MPANSYYQQAESHALKANELAADAREKNQVYQELKSTLQNWADMMGQNPIAIWTLIFVMVAIGEYLVSYDLYLDLLPRAPYIIPIAIIGISVVISHWLAHKFIDGLRQIEFEHKRHSPVMKKYTDEQIWAKVNNKANLNFVIGLLAATVFSVIIYYLSKERVQREIDAGMRTAGFGLYDSLPVVLYVAEVITGTYVVYLLQRMGKLLKAWMLKNQFDKMVRQMAMETKEAVQSFETAEQNGFSLITNTISESIHIAFYRNKNCNPSDELNYIAEPQNTDVFIRLIIDRADASLSCKATVQVFTEYNYCATGASDDKGLVEIAFRSFAGDTVKKIVAGFTDSSQGTQSGTYLTNNTNPHRVLFRELFPFN